MWPMDLLFSLDLVIARQKVVNGKFSFLDVILQDMIQAFVQT